MQPIFAIALLLVVSLVFSSFSQAETTQPTPTLGEMQSAFRQRAAEDQQAAKDLLQNEKARTRQAVTDETQRAKSLADEKKPKARSRDRWTNPGRRPRRKPPNG